MKELFGIMKEQILNSSQELEKVYSFSKTPLNIVQNFIPHEAIICDDRDPPWINKEIKMVMVEKSSAFKWYCCSK